MPDEGTSEESDFGLSDTADGEERVPEMKISDCELTDAGISIDESEIPTPAEMAEIYTHEDESILMNVIMSGDKERATVVLEGFFGQVDCGNREKADYLVMNLIRTFVKLIANIKISKEDNKYNFEHMLRIIKLESVDAMKEAAVEIACDICSGIEQIKPDNDKSVSKRVMEYVEQNYTDRELDVSKISDFLKFSPSYSIKLFKQESGEGISNYINRTRVEKAKELLVLDVYRVEQIAKMVGFYDSRALSRSFKRFYGVTPTQYRDISFLETNNGGNK